MKVSFCHNGNAPLVVTFPAPFPFVQNLRIIMSNISGQEGIFLLVTISGSRDLFVIATSVAAAFIMVSGIWVPGSRMHALSVCKPLGFPIKTSKSITHI